MGLVIAAGVAIQAIGENTARAHVGKVKSVR